LPGGLGEPASLDHREEIAKLVCFHRFSAKGFLNTTQKSHRQVRQERPYGFRQNQALNPRAIP
jgi:hypothetical protein